MINAYSFGSITIDGRQFTKDVVIGKSGVLSPWWRKEGHSLSPDDLESVVVSQPEVLVIGTGSFGAMKVPADTLGALMDMGIEPRVMRTAKAVEEFNRLLMERGPDSVMTVLHLTC